MRQEGAKNAERGRLPVPGYMSYRAAHLLIMLQEEPGYSLA